MTTSRRPDPPRSAGFLLALVLSGCGYKVIAPDTLPDGVPCASVSAVVNQTGESALELELSKALDAGLARRGLSCPGGAPGGLLRAELERLEWGPAVFGQDGTAAARVGAYRVRARVKGWFEARPGVTRALGPVEGELEFIAEEALPGSVGLARTGALQQRWTALAETLAERLIVELTTDF